jgi:hypothetical protein
MRPRAAPVRWRQYLCRAGSAHNSVVAASIAAAMTVVSIGPSWPAKAGMVRCHCDCACPNATRIVSWAGAAESVRRRAGESCLGGLGRELARSTVMLGVLRRSELITRMPAHRLIVLVRRTSAREADRFFKTARFQGYLGTTARRDSEARGFANMTITFHPYFRAKDDVIRVTIA